MEESRISFRVLGDVELVGSEGAVTLAGELQRALLAALLANAGAVVSVDRLVEGLWTRSLPANPSSALQSQVHRLRRALAVALPGGDEALARVGTGYRLAVSPHSVDAGLFDALVARAGTETPADAITSLRRALALWRGPAYAEVADSDLARVEAIRLEEARIAAVERLGALLVETNQPAAAVPLLEAFVAEHPLNEAGRQALVRALAGMGRQADALATYRDYRDVLADELGLEPSASMRRLEVEVLRGELALPVPQQTGQQPAQAAAEDGTSGPGLDRMRVRYVATPRGQVAVGEVGTGPTLLSLPGWLSSLDIVASGRDPRSSVLQRLTGRFCVTMYDRAGTGLSRTVPPDASLDAAVQELEAVVEAVGAPLAVLAMSQAGPVSVALAASRPELVSRLVLFGTYVHGRSVFTNAALRESVVAMLRSHHGMGSRVLAGLYRPDSSPEAAQHLARVLRDSADQQVAADYLQAVYDADVRDLVGKVRCPALVLHYRQDRVIPFVGGQQLATGLPDVRFLPLDGAFHLPDARDLDRIVSEVAEFCGEGE